MAVSNPVEVYAVVDENGSLQMKKGSSQRGPALFISKKNAEKEVVKQREFQQWKGMADCPTAKVVKLSESTVSHLAVLAVINLHNTGPGEIYCTACGRYSPCPTIQEISKVYR